jgi:hypothetical protein
MSEETCALAELRAGGDFARRFPKAAASILSLPLLDDAAVSQEETAKEEIFEARIPAGLGQIPMPQPERKSDEALVRAIRRPQSA